MSPFVEHVNLTVGDLEEAIRFLTTAIPEFVVRHRGVTDGKEWVHVGTSESYVALSQASERQQSQEPYTGIGFNHAGIVVSDADQVANALRQAGYREGFQADPHPYRKRVYFHDADNNEWEFVEYLTEDASLRNDYSM
ncbi:MAG: VOC family protein [Planctomycetaceae bacterium]|nr:VOC family protein [Planctomycetaceae bacterium]